MKNYFTALLASLLLLSCCTSPPKRNHEREGEIYIVPTWTKGSLEKFLVWVNDRSGPGEENREEFQRKLKEKIRAGFGSKFPRAELPNTGDELFQAIAHSGAQIEPVNYISYVNGSRQDPSKQHLKTLLAPAGSRNPDLSDEDIKRLVEDPLNELADSLNDAVQAKNKDITTNYPPNSKVLLRGLLRGVRYIVEQGVTYCVYGSYALEWEPDDATEADGAGKWVHWKVSHEGVTAWLNVYLIVTEL